MTAANETKLETIDMTPTWEGLLPMLLAAYTDGNAGRSMAFAELRRMVQIADVFVAESKAERPAFS